MFHYKMALNVVYIILKKMYKLFQICKCSKRFCGTQRQSFGVLFAIITLTAASYMLTRDNQPILRLNETIGLVEERLKEYYLDEKGMGCEIPKPDPFSAEAMKFIMDLPKVTCKGFDWVICNKSECYVKEEVFKNMSDISCSYRDIVYVHDNLQYQSDSTTVTGSEKYTLNRSDHVKVSCSGRDLNSYSILYSRWSGLKAGFRKVIPKPIPPNRKDSFNVIFLAFDSASHNGFIRNMPKSFKYIADRAVILNGLNIIGDGTPAALYPILTGKAEHENPDARTKITDKLYVDHKLFIFHQLKKYGYRTAYFEDSPLIGTFTYRYNGFRQQPADHYLRALLLENEKRIFNFFKRCSNEFCVGDTPQYQLFLNLTSEFLQLDGKKFGFTFISDICHDNFNQISTADDAVVSFLETLTARRVFEDTLVIVMGDHGPRFGKCASHQRKVEERLPLVAIFLPEKLKQLRPEALNALKQNKDVLTTFLDVHSTLLDVLDLKELSNKYKIPGSDLPRAMSLLEPIPKTRICAEAGIVQHWCACFKWFDVSQLDPMYNRVAIVLAEYIDSICEEQRSKCARRKLISTESVLQHNVNNQVLTYKYSREEHAFLGNSGYTAPRPYKEYYQAKIILSPGRGVFEATITYNTQTDSFTINRSDISRISAYADEPKCVSATHPHLNPFCYCNDHVPKQYTESTSQEIKSDGTNGL